MKTYVVEAKHGKMILLRGDFISNVINTYGEWCDSEIRIFISILKNGGSVIEVGSNIGTHAIPIAKILGANGKIHCFEPQRILHQVLCGNIAINDLTNSYPYNLAVGDKEETILIPKLNYSEGLNYGGLSLTKGFESGEKINAVRLDDFYFEGGLSDLKLIKIDVEGMERNVLNGAKRIINELRPCIFLEANWNREELFALLSELKYNCYWFCSRYFNNNNYYGTKHNILGIAGDIDWLCVPEDLEQQPVFLTKITESENLAFSLSECKFYDYSKIIDDNWLQ